VSLGRERREASGFVTWMRGATAPQGGETREPAGA